MKTLKTILAIAIISILASCSKSDDEVPNQQSFTPELNFSNGNLSTGTTASTGASAPTGYTWSEPEVANIFFGFQASPNSNFFLADDFIVPQGEKWSINKFVFYAYQTNYVATNSPFDNIKYEIFSIKPSEIGATKIFGDFTNNKFESSEDAKMYRIKNGFPNQLRKIYKITASATNIELMPGTYWIKWQTNNITNTLHYHPYNTTIGVAGLSTYNALTLSDVGVWSVCDSGASNKADFPFGIIGTKTKL